jgi:hypothetical protein
LQYLSELKAISFPTIRKWTIEGSYEFLASLDVSGADALDFWSVNPLTDRLLNPIPNKLTKLVLSHVLFIPESLLGGQPYFLPFLNSLALSDVIFFGPMRKYFLCPNLNRLDYDISPHELSQHNIAMEFSENPYSVPIRDALDQAFFQESSTLKYISLGGTKMDDVLVPILEHCPVLYCLEIAICRIGTFIQPFLEKLQDPKYLPTLRILDVDDSWPIHPALSFNEFVVQCGSKRRELYVCGNGRQMDPDFYNSDGSEFDYIE